MHREAIIVLDRVTQGQMTEKIAIRVESIETLQLLGEQGQSGETRCEVTMASGKVLKLQHNPEDVFPLNPDLLARFEI